MKVVHCPGNGTPEGCADCPIIEEAREVLRDGGSVVYPTDTLYGLGVRVHDEEAVGSVFRVKDRPSHEPVPVGVRSREAIGEVSSVEEGILELLAPLLHKPITWLLPAREGLPSGLVSDQGLVGVRVLRSQCPQRLMEGVGPITSTSANLHGDPQPLTVEDARRSLGDAVQIYIDAGRSPLGGPSTVVRPRYRTDPPEVFGVMIIREGWVKGKLVRETLLG